MRKILFAAMLLIGLSYHVHAQEHQFTFGFGTPSSNHIADVFFTVSNSIILNLIGEDSKLENQKSLGEVRLGYAYYPIDRLSVGVTASYLHSSSDVIKNGVYSGEYISKYLTFATEGTYDYIKREKMRLYGLLGAGFTNLNSDYQDGNRNDSDATNYFNFHVSPIGIAFGNRFGGTAEIGVGYRGIVSLGLFYKL